MKLPRLAFPACRFCGACAFTTAWWTLWIFLGALAALQLYLLLAREIVVPAFVLRATEHRLATARLTARLGRAVFDPSGGLAIENVQLGTPAFAEPLFTARALYTRFDVWRLLAGRIGFREIRASGASLMAPAMFSPSGRAEAVVGDCDFDLVRSDKNLDFAQLVGRLGELTFTAHGALQLPTAGPSGAPLNLTALSDFLTQKYPPLSRVLIGKTSKFALFEQPELRLELKPSEVYSALIAALFTARSFQISEPAPVHVDALRLTLLSPLLSKTPTHVFANIVASEISSPKLLLPGVPMPIDAQAQTVHVRLHGMLSPEFQFSPLHVHLAASRLDALSLHAESLSAHLRAPTPSARIQADILTRLEGAPIALQTEADLKNKNARADFDLAVASTLFGPLGQWAHTDLADLLKLQTPLHVRGRAELNQGWRLGRIAADLDGGSLVAKDVPLDAVQGHVELAGHDLRVTDIVLRQHENLAQGSYTMDTATRDYRFLLTGRLRPLEIAGWFHPNWSVFWKNFDFPATPPAADVDVRGRWHSPELTDVFVFADAPSPVIRGVAFDRTRGIVHMLHDFYDGREILLVQGARSATGRFHRLIDRAKDQWSHMDFEVTSNLDLNGCARLFGSAGEQFLAPFKFAQPPSLHASGALDSPISPRGKHRAVQISIASNGDFSALDFPLSDVSADAVLRDDDIDLPRVNAALAGGTLSGEAYFPGPESARHLRFNLHLANASLGRVVATVDDFIARQKHVAPDPPTKFVQHATDISLDLTTAAEGIYHAPLSFSGNGSIAVSGPELGQIRLLGKLSELFNFTSLRFTAARSSFKIDKSHLLFPDLKITGANSAVEANGTYLLDKKTLDFNAKIYPFQESKLAITNLVGLALMPLSAVLEVKLTGTLADPSWAFTYGPTNFLRKLVPSTPQQPGPPAPISEKK